MALSNYLIPLIAFMVFANPAVFKAVRGVAGSWVATADGVATMAGLALHAIIFVLVVGFFMGKLGRSSYQGFETRDEADDANNKHFQENRIVYAVTN
jgi:hypothetical protein